MKALLTTRKRPKQNACQYALMVQELVIADVREDAMVLVNATVKEVIKCLN